MKRNILAIIAAVLLGCPGVLASESIVWDFETGLEGWHDLGAERDVTASWEDGAIKMTYYDGTPGHDNSTEQLWFTAVQVEHDFIADDYPYLELYYRTEGWPTDEPVKVLFQFEIETSVYAYCYADLDPKKNFASYEIAAYDPGWGQKYAGAMRTVYIEVPHNGDAAAKPAEKWFGASTYIDKVVLTDTPTSVDKKASWTFDTDFVSEDGEYEFVPTDSPSIDAENYKEGSGALATSPGNYVTLPECDLTLTGEFTYSMWIKTGADATAGSEEARILSYDDGSFALGVENNRLYCRFASGEKQDLTSWSAGVWQKLSVALGNDKLAVFVDGKKCATIESLGLASGSVSIGNGLSAWIDELMMCNYVLSDDEIMNNDFVAPDLIAPWTFDDGLQGWYVPEGDNRDVELTWSDGAMVMTYVDNTPDPTQGPQLWFPNVEVKTSFDTRTYGYCHIEYETVGWPTTEPVKALLEFTLTGGQIAYALFDLDPTAGEVDVDITASDPGWGAPYSGTVSLIRLEIPHNSSANPAEDWFGASTRVSEVRFHGGDMNMDTDWNNVLVGSGINKSGMERFENPEFQYYTIGLGGTTLRVDPWGFAYDRAPSTSQTSLNHRPSFSYEYWWDNAGHRFNLFNVRGGYLVDEGRYSIKLKPGTVTSFEQNLDITTGVVTTRLGLNVDGTEFTSERETFVTPDGVLVIRVKDTGAPLPLQLNVSVNEVVDFQGTYYAGEEESFVKDEDNTTAFDAGGVITAKRTATATGSVAVAVEAAAGAYVSEDCEYYGSQEADGTVTFYISPKSSFCPETADAPWTYAEEAVMAAKAKGFDALKEETAAWWDKYLNVSKVSVPDDDVMKLYAQSLFYHGIYFGNGTIPPGCFGTDVYGFFGGVCPEYDLSFSSFAMAYTGHIDETKNIADWVYSVLPKCKSQAVNGVQHHDVFRQYDDGAIYTTIMGYDGTITIQGEPQEGQNLLQNYPGLNAARMALNYLDYSDDQSFKDAAYDVLKSTTYVALEDLVDNGKGGYRDGKIPNCMQEGAVLMGFQQCLKRGIAEPEWIEKYKDKIEYPSGLLNGEPILSSGCGHNPAKGEGGSTWNYPLWWATVVDKEDPMAVNYVKNCENTFEEYCFNNGWNGVANAKIFRGNNALMWLRNFQRPEVLLDETSFSENATDAGINYTPEVGANGAYICNLTQMLIDPDEDDCVDIFPAIPDEWEYETIGFENLMTTGALSLNATRSMDGVSVSIENRAGDVRSRKLRIKVPRSLLVSALDDVEYTVEDGFIITDVNLQPGESRELEFVFSFDPGTSGVESVVEDETVKSYVVYPNPNATGTISISNYEDIKSVDIYTMGGMRVFHDNASRQSYDIGSLGRGFYIVSLATEEGNSTCRLIVR